MPSWRATWRRSSSRWPIRPTRIRRNVSCSLKSAIVSRDQWEQRVKDAQVKLQATIGDAEGISGSWGKITWKAIKDTLGVDWEKIARERQED